MTDSGAPEPPPMSPCIRVCRMDDEVGYCVGCWRTRDEIASWFALSDERKRFVRDDLHRRASASGPD